MLFYLHPGSWGSTDLSDCGPSLVTKCVKKEKKVSQEDDAEILQKLQRDDVSVTTNKPGLLNVGHALWAQ